MPVAPIEGQLSEQSQSDPTEEEVRGSLDRVLASGTFAQSGRMARFLGYIVEETLNGRSELLKEYPIAIEAFERDDSFDPQTSSLVRVEAGRLRTKLHEYYDSDGTDDPVIIELPRGGYVPTFAHQPSPENSVIAQASTDSAFAAFPMRRELMGAAAILILTLFAGVAWWLMRPIAQTEPPRERGRQAAIAVLPLRNLTGDPGQDYLADGITDAIISRLAKSHKFRVASMTSVMHLKNSRSSVSEIGRKLNVNHLLEGTVQRSEDRVQISAKLIDVSSNRHLWVETFERPLSDILPLQVEIARKVGQSLSGSLVTDSLAAEEPTATLQPEAYEAYLRGRYFRNKITESGFHKAISYFKQAISIAPGYAPARAELAGCYCLLGGHGFELVPPKTGMPQAKKAAKAALRIDDKLAEPYAYLGMIGMKYDWDWKAAERDLKRSIELKPNFYLARLFYSLLLETRGLHAEAQWQAKLARAINPLSLQAQVNLGWQYLQAGMLELARTQFESALALEPKFWGAHWALGHYYRRQGLNDEAIASFNRAVSSGGGHVLPLSALGHAYAISGRRDDAFKIIKKLKLIERSTYVSPFSFATIYVGLGEDTLALEQLERAYMDRSRSLAWLNVMPEYDRLRKSPKFMALIRKIGLPRRNN